MASIRTAGLTKVFGDLRAVNQIDLDLPEGGVAGFVGPNGAGKSTTIRMLLGLVTPTSGDGEVLGHPIDRPAAYLHRVGALIEAPAFYPALSGEENLRVFATLGGHDRSRIAGLLDVVGLRERGGDRYSNYSLGMKQRLGIALALLPDPDLLILDEPTNGLDPQGIVEIRSLLMQLGASGKTVFVSSHLLAEIQAACDSIVMIDHGGVIFSGSMADLLARNSPTIRAAAHDATDTARLIELVADAGYPAARVNGAIEIVAPAEWTAELNRLAWQAGITLGELQATSADLEQAFFAMTVDTRKGVS
jgi:ABC-2 type transport system ATP-binding protein